ncbi:MAG: MBL fold metallo-hydrolase [Proteobacteria bacterium]|nr:MBL fold metallo-hydrolase [Pseudomonadota bacterium]MBU4469602.1 MBL fold metallo-hydrolase [Pseudomonadota bacterium]MCG2753280.1 MBL fold metallo-hydrolase [Desulfobacteraceae bacterium]
MIIKCWGSRGSIPVSGREYDHFGGDTTCLEIRTKNDEIIILDAGTGIRRLGKQLIAEKRFQYHLIFTHAHWDHILGFPFFKPIYLKQAQLIIHQCPFEDDFVKKMISKTISPPNFPLRYQDISASIQYKEGCPDPFTIGSVRIIPIELSHPNGGKGYKFIEDGKTFVFLTDNELGYVHPGGLPREDYLDYIQDADLLFHDAEYTPEEYKVYREFGHSSFTDVLDLALDAGVKKLGLFHLNQDRSDQDMNRMIKTCRKIIADRGSNLECFAAGTDMTFDLV